MSEPADDGTHIDYADQFRVLFAEAPIGMLLMDGAATVVRANGAMLTLLGYDTKELVGRSFRELTIAEDQDRASTPELLAGSADSGLAERRLMRSDGRIVSARVFTRRMKNLDGSAMMIAVIIDDTERKEVEKRLRYEAFHDRMTGLPNRALFLDRVGQALIRDAPGAVIVVGLDRMRAINEAFGHSVGDRLVVEVSRRLLAAAGREGTVGRIGGDEFAVLLTHGFDDASSVEHVGNAGRAVVTQDHRDLSTTVSVGVRKLSGLEAPELVLSDALLALQRAKQLGRNRTVVYEPSLRGRASRTAEIARQLRDAIARGEIEVDYQPIHRARDRALTGYEALVRWRRGSLGNVAPTEFVPVAEERGFIQLIGAHVLEHALAALAGWRARFPETADGLTMSINLSPLQVRDGGHMDLLGETIARSDVPAGRVKIEITESVFVDLTPEIVDSLESLRKVGVQLVLDDFGTGYSSLNHLQALPFDGLKVDRAFVARALADVRSRNLVRSIASLAGGLSMHSVAEGVETDAQREFLRDAGYDYLQGYLFGRPQSHADVERTLDASERKGAGSNEM